MKGSYPEPGGGSGKEKSGESVQNSLSPSGINTFSVKGFRSLQKLNNHWKDHSSEYADDTDVSSKEEYLSRALSLLQSPVNESVLGHIDSHGNVIRYDIAKKDFAKGNPTRGVTTMFKAERIYYENQRKVDLEHGGKA